MGGGASSLVDRLLDAGYVHLTVADISPAALEVARARLGDRAGRVSWLVADARGLRLPEPVDVWHDRAVFHFLTEAADQEAYLQGLRAAVRVGGHAVMATFAPDGPERCSGLPVERYDGAALARRFGPGFELVRSFTKAHATPSGGTHSFTYAVLRRVRAS